MIKSFALVVLSLYISIFSHAETRPASCGGQLADSDAHYRAMQTLMDQIHVLYAPGELEAEPWYKVLKHFSLAARTRSKLLVASTFGGGNAGKSSFFNMIPGYLRGLAAPPLGEPISAPAKRAGFTRQMVVLLGRVLKDKQDGYAIQQDLDTRFPGLSEWTRPEETAETGRGLIHIQPELPGTFAVVDTPDFDTAVHNREEAQRVVRSSDVLFVVLNDETVSNMNNTELIRQTFAESGKKRIVLLIKVFADPDGEIRRMMVRFAHAIYGTTGEHFPPEVLGAYIMENEKAVFLGEKTANILPLALDDQRMSSAMVDLIASILKNSDAHKRFALSEAARVIERSLDQKMRASLRTNLVDEIYRQSLALTIAGAVSARAAQFPFAVHLRRLRDAVLVKEGGAWRGFESLASLVGGTWLIRSVLGVGRFFGRGRATAAQRADLAASRRTDVVSALQALVAGQVSAEANPRSLALMDLINQYNAVFSPRSELRNLPGRSLGLTLPSLDFASPEIKLGLRNLTGPNLPGLQARILAALEPAAHIEAGGPLDPPAIDQVTAPRALITRVRGRLNGAVSLFATVAGTTAIVLNTPDDPASLTNLLGCVGVSGLVMAAHNYWDLCHNGLKIEVQDRFRAQQIQAVYDAVLGGLSPRLSLAAQPDPIKTRAEHLINEALNTLNPERISAYDSVLSAWATVRMPIAVQP